MKLPRDSEIARLKVTQYLLKLREEDDKPNFLRRPDIHRHKLTNCLTIYMLCWTAMPSSSKPRIMVTNTGFVAH